MAGVEPRCDYSLRELNFMARKNQCMEWEKTSRLMWAVTASMGNAKNKPSDFNPFKEELNG